MKRIILHSACALLTLVLLSTSGTGSAATRPSQRHGSADEQVQAQPAASIQALTVVGRETVYAGSFGLGIFRSDDRGRSWVAANAGLTDFFVLCMATGQNGVVYAGTFRGGVFRSQDSGKSWHAVNAGLKRLEIKALLVASEAIYAGTGDGVYKLSQGRDQWAVVTSGLDDILVHALAKAADGTLFAGTSGKGVLRYKEPGAGWMRLRHGLKDHEGMIENFIRVLAIDKHLGLYAGTFDGGVFLSADGGQTWRPISRALPNDSIRGILTNERGVIVGTGHGIFKTVDQGRQWMPLNKGLAAMSVQVLIDSGEGSLYAGTSSGVFRSDDEGLNWLAVNEGLQGGAVSPFR
ncbi:MAG: hypothetical protein ACT4OO_14535 [Nitrospiraceae bacterium]